MFIRILTLIIVIFTTGCALLKAMPNNVPKGSFEFHSIARTRGELRPVGDSSFIITFSSNIDYRTYRVFWFTCLLKDNGIISNKDFDNAQIVAPKNPHISFTLYGSSSVYEENNQFIYSMKGYYLGGVRDDGIDDSGPKAYTDETIRDKIPDIGITCAFYDSYPLTLTRRFISNSMIIPKEDFIKILQ